MNFYEKILSHKAITGNKWDTYGKPLEMKKDAIRVAIKRKSLDRVQIAELKKVFLNELEEENNIFIDGITIDLDVFAKSILDNYEILRKHPVFKVLLEKEIAKGVLKTVINEDKFKSWLHS